MHTKLLLILLLLAGALLSCGDTLAKKLTLTGKLSRYDAQLTLVQQGAEIKGEFQYLTLNRGIITVKGLLTDSHLRLEEFNGKGEEVTGVFDGNFDGRMYQGFWSGPDQDKGIRFQFKVVTMEEEQENEAPRREEDRKISYQVTKRENDVFVNTLVARLNNQDFTLIDEEDERCLIVESVQDFDGDGYDDVLINHLEACGGTCCPFNPFFFISYREGKGFTESDVFGSAGHPPTIEKMGEGEVTVAMTSVGELTSRGYITYDERYILQNGQAVKVSEKVYDQVIDALVEIKSGDFERFSGTEKKVYYDIDGDGEKDALTGSVWGNANLINWSIQFANGKRYKNDDDFSYFRIGVLPSKTNGRHDLVGDLADVLTWDGKRYVPRE